MTMSCCCLWPWHREAAALMQPGQPQGPWGLLLHGAVGICLLNPSCTLGLPPSSRGDVQRWELALVIAAGFFIELCKEGAWMCVHMRCSGQGHSWQAPNKKKALRKI